MMAWKSTADSVSSFSSRIETLFLGDGATENRSFFAASFWTGDGATLNRRVFFGDDGASSVTTGVTGPRLAADKRDTTSGNKL